MILIDTHAHIYDPQFDDDRDAMLQQAERQQVGQIWMPNCALETVPGLMALAEQYPDRCLPMMGLHPSYVSETVETELAAVEDSLKRNAFMAVGEIGLDFYWDMTYVDQQFMAFETQLRWAAEQKLPVSMHTRSGPTQIHGGRNAFAEAADLIEKLALPGLTGIFHCFVGTLDEANRAIEMGFKLGIGGVSTFKNGGLDKVLPYVSLEHLVLETDAPYLAPVPHRGKRNEPAYLTLIAQRVADLKQVSLSDVAHHTTANALSLLPALYANLLPE